MKKNKDKIKRQVSDQYEKKEEKIKQVKEYREKNKESLNAHAKERLVCECGGRYTRGNKSTHIKSKKHKDYVFRNVI
jgi:hypothetical protein